MEIDMNTKQLLFVATIAVVVPLLAACSVNSESTPTDKNGNDLGIEVVCLDHVEYWYRGGTAAVLAPRIKPAVVGTVTHSQMLITKIKEYKNV